MKKILPLFILTILLISPVTAFAKGPFSFITIKGAGITEEITVDNPALLDFFAFANFSNVGLEAPANPGKGYEIMRCCVIDSANTPQNFDHLHYYPATGYVYYDGLLGGGWSEYDGKWNKANPEIKSIFLGELPPKGDFAYITVIGQGLAGELTLTSDAFVKDFFAFANFDENKIDPPADYDRDFGFEISRYRIVDEKAKAADKLYYYPDQGYIYYAASEEESPYTDQWYTANPEIEAPFRAALAERATISWIPTGIFVVMLIIFGFIYFRTKPKQK
jgi:hypothetical protein